MTGIDYIYELLKQHYDEASEGLVDKAPSRLSRGEGTEKNFYIMKIDLAGSTGMLLGRKKGTYLKLAHTFLSSIDKITQDFGADPNQTEYAGDSVLAYFPETETTAENVMRAASYSRAAVLGIQRLDTTLNSLQLKCKVVLHFDTLLVSKIGPRANSFTTAIGFPLHVVAKLEKEISADTGWATEKFFQKVIKENQRYLNPVYKDEACITPQQAVNTVLTPQNNTYNALAQLLYPPVPPQTVIGYKLKWLLLFRDLKLNYS